MTDPKKTLDTETAKAFEKPLETAIAALSKLTDLVLHTEQQSHAAVVNRGHPGEESPRDTAC